MSVPDYSTLRVLAQQATPGPWEALSDGFVRAVTEEATDEVAYIGVTETSDADAAYIAAVSPTVLTTILDELELLDRVARRNNRMLDDAKAQLAEAQAETRVVAAQRNTRGEAVIRLTAERDALAAQIAGVRALHERTYRTCGCCDPDDGTCPNAVTVCGECYSNAPCPTIRALDAAQTGEPT